MNEKNTAQTQKEEREEVLKEIRQLENRKKILENKQRNEERRVRTRRLIERGAVLEGIFPLAPDLSGAEVKAVLITLSHLPGAAELTANLPKSGDTPSVPCLQGRTYTPLPVLCALPGALRTSSAMGSYAPQTPCALCTAKHPLCVCPAPQSLLSPH